MKISGTTNCPTCKKDHEVELDIENLTLDKVTKPKIENSQVSGLQTEQIIKPEIKEIEKIVEKVKIPSDQPFYECKDCDALHKNKNYSVRPNKKCSNCDSLNGPKNKGCKNCGNTEFEELDEEQLDNLGVPKPEEHEHEPRTE